MTLRSSSGKHESSRNITETSLPLCHHGTTNDPNPNSPEYSRILKDIPSPDRTCFAKEVVNEIPLDIHKSNLQSEKRILRSRARVSYTEKLELELPNDDSEAGNEPNMTEESKVQAELTSANDVSSINDNGPKESMFPEKLFGLRGGRDLEKSNNTRVSIRSNKGIDLSLPPLSSLEDCMHHMVSKAVDLGLLESLKRLKGRTLRIATMCSGTESPLLALEEISRALEKQGHQPIRFQQEFSAEIEVFKQAFIERNFRPKILFRDVREFICDSATTATTAYGAKVDIPTDIDILVVGFVCKDLSRMNNNGKTLEGGGESGDTWLAIYTYAKRFRPSIVLLENVKSEKATWEDVVSRWNNIEYEASWVFCDTKRYYLPQTRERMYMVAIERSHFGKGAANAVNLWKNTMQHLERPCSSPYEAFLPRSSAESHGYSALRSEPEWTLCKLRNDHIRSEKRLGILRPVSRRNDNGTVMPPDFADRKFYNSQSTRVHDAIDIAHLESAQKGYDSLYKMALWDVSQNVDRFRGDLGLSTCITPAGQVFSSNRQCALNGSELLLLQDMPLSKLILANETQRDLQNLAGNAMSTTVIGASIISALICGSKAFLPKPSGVHHEPPTIESFTPQIPIIVQSDYMQQTLLQPRTYRELELDTLQQDARLSEQMCSCEGKHITSKSAIRLCSACGHSACISCAGNPKHVYEETMLSNYRKQAPHEFMNRWRSELPPRLELEIFPGIRRLACDIPGSDPILRSYLDLTSKVQNDSRHFCIGDLVREHQYWKITYDASHAWLELKVGQKIEWLVFLKCPSELCGDNLLRKFLESPIMHGTVGGSLFEVEWKMRLPDLKSYPLRIRGLGDRASSWRNRLGLQDYKEETVPSILEISCNDQELMAVSGQYEYLPHCGTASNSLYKKLAKDERLFLFLDPDPIGNPECDSFVFSRDQSKKGFGESRIITAYIDPSWRPWHIKHEGVHIVNATSSDIWAPITVGLRSACIPIDVRFLDERFLSKSCIPRCSEALTFLDVLVHSTITVQTYSDYSWALELPRSLPSYISWKPIDLNCSSECPCAPPYPKLIWSVDEKGIATAHQDHKAAAIFERATKTSPPIFQLKASNEGSNTRIRVALNVRSLIHRARRRLSVQKGTMKVAWRLVTNHVDLSPQPFGRFTLQNNARDPNYNISVTPTYLRGTQLKSLQWMITQELGKRITIAETEEAIHSGLGWKLEALAEVERYVRGGVLADRPSFGKTVTTIALIQNEFETNTPEAILQKNQVSETKLPGLMNSVATLVVCPPHITRQWQSEIEKFLPAKQLQAYNVLVVEEFAQLRSLSIEEVLASRVIVVSWALFTQQDYVCDLARIAALPEPAMNSRRGIDAWMSRAIRELPGQLNIYEKYGYQEFEKRTRGFAEERLRHREFTASLPLKIKHGSAYQSFSITQSAANATKGPKKDIQSSVTQKRKTDRTALCLLPLLHLFQFNRIVIDEYHYLNNTRKLESHMIATAIRLISAHKRWVLSGTPALTNFSDVNQIASFFGISLGRYHPGDSAVPTDIDQTDFESFIGQTEVVSRHWHEERHLRAQNFLDNFVRQNEAEIKHIPCAETLVPVRLDAAHHAVYIELSQYLASQRMQIKKLNKKSDSDRTKRLNESLENSSSAEEALLRSALLFRTEDGVSGLDHLMKKRSQQLVSTEKDLSELLSGFEALILCKKNRSGPERSITDLYSHFENDIMNYNWLGDEEASSCVRDLLLKAKGSPTSGFPEVKGSDEQRLRLSKQRLSQLRDVSLEFAQRKRSQRFIQSIQNYMRASSQNNRWICSSPDCHGTADRSQLHSMPHCGHTACKDCLGARLNDEHCVHPGCTSYVHDGSFIRMTDLGSSEGQTTSHSFGKKLDAIVDVVEKMPKTDQGIVFAPNEEVISILEDVFKHHNISYISPSHSRRAALAKLIEEFKSNNAKTNISRTKKKLLILNLGSESAAGVNLTNANHVIFVSPLLARTQYDYDSVMAQAIARSRRYGQEKKVHVYHVIARRTIDVDILKHHHKRNDAISTLKMTNKMPPASGTKERIMFVMNRQKEAILVPRSWLKDPSKKAVLDIDETTDTFTSLISFSTMFEPEGDNC
ncbi:uncharacterized protein yc1106_02464 [Curvularia clavata]|uniref:Helicase ATP-binding domain-containing protein n=1 Tax=Curvularia clavata TaxID=95742 RepID=A0A9Q9DQK5_CURCL|nr:uncharacterized protein yc1106_02464 [Curvularia clavata]